MSSSASVSITLLVVIRNLQTSYKAYSIFKVLTFLNTFLLLLNGGCNTSDKDELFCIQSNLQQEDSCMNYTAILTVIIAESVSSQCYKYVAHIWQTDTNWHNKFENKELCSAVQLTFITSQKKGKATEVKIIQIYSTYYYKSSLRSELYDTASFSFFSFNNLYLKKLTYSCRYKVNK